MMAAGASAMEIEDFVIMECITYNLFPPDVCSEMVYLAGVCCQFTRYVDGMWMPDKIVV